MDAAASALNKVLAYDDEGYKSPYAKFLEEELTHISRILAQLILAHGEHKPIDDLIASIEQWLGDDWDVLLSEEEHKRLDAIKGWTYD
ncbi:MAG TPA: hypothetical protein VHT52_17815 [Stellaceae bacterium]|nr:hypothetical protein [Stellaceae bacterium]